MAIFRLGEVSAYDSIDYFLDNLLWSYTFLKRYIYMLVCREGLLRRQPVLVATFAISSLEWHGRDWTSTGNATAVL